MAVKKIWNDTSWRGRGGGEGGDKASGQGRGRRGRKRGRVKKKRNGEDPMTTRRVAMACDPRRSLSCGPCSFSQNKKHRENEKKN